MEESTERYTGLPPETQGAASPKIFDTREGRLLSPLEGILTKGKPYEFKVRSLEASEVVVVFNPNTPSKLSRGEDGIWSSLKVIAKDSTPYISVVQRFPNGKSFIFSTICTYRTESGVTEESKSMTGVNFGRKIPQTPLYKMRGMDSSKMEVLIPDKKRVESWVKELRVEDKHQTIDKYSLQCPESEQKNIEILGRYLGKGGKNSVEKVRIIWRWITKNIDYDIRTGEVDSGGEPGGETTSVSAVSITPEEVLQTRSAHSHGYANLFNALCTVAKVESSVITGYIKGNDFKIGDTYKKQKPSHLWNAVKLNKKWFLIDCSSGSGSVVNTGDSLVFVKKYCPFYWLTAPEQLIFTHFPVEGKWQLLSKPWSQLQFLKSVKASKLFEMGLEMLSHCMGSITSPDGCLDISFISHIRGTKLRAEVTAMGGSYVEGEEVKNTSFIKKEKSTLHLLIRFPEKALYNVNILAKGIEEEDEYVGVISHEVRAMKGVGEGKGFPTCHDHSTFFEEFLLSPIDMHLQRGQTYKFQITSSKAKGVALSTQNSDWPKFLKSGNLWSLNYLLPPNCKDEISIHIRFDDDDASWNKFCTYLVK